MRRNENLPATVSTRLPTQPESERRVVACESASHPRATSRRKRFAERASVSVEAPHWVVLHQQLLRIPSIKVSHDWSASTCSLFQVRIVRVTAKLRQLTFAGEEGVVEVARVAALNEAEVRIGPAPSSELLVVPVIQGSAHSRQQRVNTARGFRSFLYDPSVLHLATSWKR